MKIKHNKKRNTAFLFETLVRELTKSIVDGDKRRGSTIKTILKEHFGRGMVLFSELDCFNSLVGTRGMDQYTAEKTVFRARHTHQSLDQDKIFKEQSKVIKKINTDLGKEVYNNFVPNYKSYATVAQIFGDKAPLKNRMLLEKQLMSEMMSPTSSDVEKSLKPIDSLVVKSFVKNYNNKYQHLLPEQRSLLSRYITSFGQHNVDFRLGLAKELKRIKEQVENSLQSEEVSQDPQMVESTKRVLEKINQYNVSNIGEKEILEILKMQNLVNEYQKDADNN